MATTDSSDKTVGRESSIRETATIHLAQHAHDLGFETTVTRDSRNIFVWNEDGETVAHVRIVADGNERDISERNTDVVTHVTGDEQNAVTSWTFETPDRKMTQLSELAHCLVESAGKTPVTKLHA